MSSPLLSASPRQLPSVDPVPASRRNNQPFSNPRAYSFVYPEPIISRTRLNSQQSTERISSCTAMFPPSPSTPIPRPNSDVESRPFGLGLWLYGLYSLLGTGLWCLEAAGGFFTVVVSCGRGPPPWAAR
ncbi:hypothetical protein BDN71DRAFT_1453215 [Pleurotus eryngii]|uniref:Uncharacterized protein n=1 Tax=Pleurotus eryngii TaxID=5323 RepID=A0A9P6DDE5_PLEER|nr:hypothetical protein BDN71DRAFT_1453215 [Pleurotus eryngii]